MNESRKLGGKRTYGFFIGFECLLNEKEIRINATENNVTSRLSVDMIILSELDLHSLKLLL